MSFQAATSRSRSVPACTGVATELSCFGVVNSSYCAGSNKPGQYDDRVGVHLASTFPGRSTQVCVSLFKFASSMSHVPNREPSPSRTLLRKDVFPQCYAWPLHAFACSRLFSAHGVAPGRGASAVGVGTLAHDRALFRIPSLGRML